MTTMNRKEAKEQLRTWVEDKRADNFHSLLYTLIAKSDNGNRERLRKGFPNEVAVYEDWFRDSCSDLEDFWRRP